MSISVNPVTIKNNFDLLMNYAKGDDLHSDKDHTIYKGGFWNNRWYTPITLEDIEWTIQKVIWVKELVLDRKDPQNAPLLALNGEVKNLEYLFRSGIERFVVDQPVQGEQVKALLAQYFVELPDLILNVNAPRPPTFPEKVAKQMQKLVWVKHEKPVLTNTENASRPTTNFRDELLKKIQTITPRSVEEIENKIKLARGAEPLQQPALPVPIPTQKQEHTTPIFTDEFMQRIQTTTPLTAEQIEYKIKLARTSKQNPDVSFRPIQETLINRIELAVLKSRPKFEASETEMLSEITSVASRPLTATSADSEGED